MNNKSAGRSKKTGGPTPRRHLDPVLDTKSVAKHSDQLTEYMDLTGLVYPKMTHPVIMVGLPQPYVGVFYDLFSRPGAERSVVKKPTGNRHYVRLSRAADVYRVCQALDGRTKVHQKAVTVIMKKLETKYGKKNLETPS